MIPLVHRAGPGHASGRFTLCFQYSLFPMHEVEHAPTCLECILRATHYPGRLWSVVLPP
jgi:hypothetical protein